MWWQAQFHLGRKNADPMQPGVFVRQFETYNAHDFEDMWVPCFGDYEWCMPLKDRVSASIINTAIRGLFKGDNGGYVISASRNEMLCAWAVDAGSVNLVCQPPGKSPDCVPGCMVKAAPSDKDSYRAHAWCESYGLPAPGDTLCPWGPSHVSEMVQQHEKNRKARTGALYNEVILDGGHYLRNLPYSIEAFYYTSDETSNHVWRAHQAFLKAYSIPASRVPLLRLDLSRETDPFMPSKCNQAGDDTICWS